VQPFELQQILAQRESPGAPYLEFLRVPDLSMGLYVLAAGGVDSQSPHTEDEVYVVMEGKAVLRIAEHDHPVRAGSVAYVAKNVEHRFHSIESELRVLVFFAPAEYSRQGD
jgi:mannose-6-phosphate isomerase-like protein (cupin superfamily)